jgi:hypothetical protein
MTTRTPAKNVLLLLCEGAELSEAAAFVDVLGWVDIVRRGPSHRNDRIDEWIRVGVHVWCARTRGSSMR